MVPMSSPADGAPSVVTAPADDAPAGGAPSTVMAAPAGDAPSAVTAVTAAPAAGVTTTTPAAPFGPWSHKVIYRVLPYGIPTPGLHNQTAWHKLRDCSPEPLVGEPVLILVCPQCDRCVDMIPMQVDPAPPSREFGRWGYCCNGEYKLERKPNLRIEVEWHPAIPHPATTPEDSSSSDEL